MPGSLSETKVSGQAKFRLPAFHGGNEVGQNYRMPDKTLPLEIVRENRKAMDPVRKLLKERGFNQRSIAALMDVSEPTVSKWLSGRQNMTHAQFRKIAGLLGAKPAEMVGGPEEQARLTRYAALAALAGAMSDDQLAALEAVAEQLAAQRKR